MSVAGSSRTRFTQINTRTMASLASEPPCSSTQNLSSVSQLVTRRRCEAWTCLCAYPRAQLNRCMQRRTSRSSWASGPIADPCLACNLIKTMTKKATRCSRGSVRGLRRWKRISCSSCKRTLSRIPSWRLSRDPRQSPAVTASKRSISRDSATPSSLKVLDDARNRK